MGTVIYSANPLQSFLGSLGTILFLVALGLVGIGIAAFRRSQGRNSRILLGALGGFLLIVSCVVAGITLTSASSGTETVALHLDNKRVVQDTCGDNGETCPRYVLESTTSSTAYDFNVPQDAYLKAQVDSCYRFTYYPNKGLLANSNPSFQQIDHVARIETADPSACQ